MKVVWRREDFRGEHGGEVSSKCGTHVGSGRCLVSREATQVRSGFMPTGFTLLSVGDDQGGTRQTRGHGPVEDTSMERRTALPEPGLEGGDVSSELLPGKERPWDGMPARASSIWWGLALSHPREIWWLTAESFAGAWAGCELRHTVSTAAPTRRPDGTSPVPGQLRSLP